MIIYGYIEILILIINRIDLFFYLISIHNIAIPSTSLMNTVHYTLYSVLIVTAVSDNIAK